MEYNAKLGPQGSLYPCFSTLQVTPCLVTPVSRVKAPNRRISTQQITPGQVIPVSRVTAPEVPALPHPSPQSGPMISSSTSNPIIPRATPVIRANTTAFPCPPGQVSPVTRGNAPELASFQTSQATAASLSSQSANTHPSSNKDNNSFKRQNCTTQTANSSTPPAVSTVLTPDPGSPVASVSCLFKLPQVFTAQASAHSRPPKTPT